MNEETVVQFGAPTLAGIKTGSLFSCLYDTKSGVYEDVRRLNRVLTPRGLCLLPLRFGEKRVVMYLFRPSGLETDLRCRGARRILRDAGYDDASMGKCMRCLIRRLRESESFPHEIGLFLSYPPEDVRGFIENKAQNFKLVGTWKVYGDVDAARRTFARYQKCTESYCRAYSAGLGLEQLAVAI